MLSDPVTEDERLLLDRAMPLVNERMNKLAEAPGLLGFLFADEESFTRDEADVEKVLDESGRGVVRASYEALAALDDWDDGRHRAGAAREARRGARVSSRGTPSGRCAWR